MKTMFQTFACIALLASAPAHANIVATTAVETAVQMAMNSISQAGTVITIVNDSGSTIRFVDSEFKLLEGEISTPINTDNIQPGQAAVFAIAATFSSYGLTGAQGTLLQLNADGAGTNAKIFFDFRSTPQLPGTSPNTCTADYAPGNTPDPQFEQVYCKVGQTLKTDMRIYISPLF